MPKSINKKQSSSLKPQEMLSQSKEKKIKKIYTISMFFASIEEHTTYAIIINSSCENFF